MSMVAHVKAPEVMHVSLWTPGESSGPYGGSCEGTCSDACVWCGHQMSQDVHGGFCEGT